MPHAQTVSINKMRADAVVVTRGFFTLVILPGFYLLLMILPMVRDLPHPHLAPLRSPLVWLLAALTVSAGFAARYGTARLTAPYLWILIIGGISVTAVGGAASMVAVGKIDLGRLEQQSTGVLLGLAALLLLMLILILVLFCWTVLLPIKAAIRLLATRLPPDRSPLPRVLAFPQPQRDAGHAAAPSTERSRAAVAYIVAAVGLGIMAAAPILWLLASSTTTMLSVFRPGRTSGWTPGNEHVERTWLALILDIAAIYLVRLLWRRARQHAAIDAQAALRNDPRRPILYLRSFQDDPHLLGVEWDVVVRSRYGRAGRLPGPIARFIASMGTGILATSGRLEENIATIVAPIGPFVGIGAPDEPLPQLGAARAYFTSDTWQSAIIEWVDAAQLIVKIAGPTAWIRWELDTILNRNAWPKLLVVMPPATKEDHAARWGNIVAVLHDTPWRDALGSLDPHQVIAIRLLDGGGISAVTSDRRRAVDYLLAIRIMLYQMHTAVPT